MRAIILLRRVTLLAVLVVAMSACVDLGGSSEHLGPAENPVYVGDDGEAWPDNIEDHVLLDEEFTTDADTVQRENDEHQIVSDDFTSPLDEEMVTTLETLPEYAAKCDAAIGVTVPDFICDAGTLIPTTNYDGSKCDRPNRLNRQCDPNSRFRVLTNTENAFVVALCRKKSNNASFYGDIAVIQHNKKSGATCFYQSKVETGFALDGNVKAPSKGSGAWPWLSPGQTAELRCGACHDNGPIIRSPYLTQITGNDKLPGAGESFTFNFDQPYYFVGADFASWKAYKVEVVGNTCTNCHRMGTSNLFVGPRGLEEGGAALDLGIRATATSEEAKNPHSFTSPIWMTPTAITYQQSNFDAAAAIRACATRRFENPLPNSSTCRITQYTGRLFLDDFETNQGWVLNPDGTDTATSGKWDIGDPEPTTVNGQTFQLGTPPSGTNALVTGRLAGASWQANDVDNGKTTIQSPSITLPAGASLTLEFTSYLAHDPFATNADSLKIKVKEVGVAGSTVVYQELAASAFKFGAWTPHNVNISAFAGRTIVLQIEATDASPASVIEAAVDLVAIRVN